MMRIGNLQTTPWYLRLVVFVVIAGVMYGAFWYFVTRGTRTETAALNAADRATAAAQCSGPDGFPATQ